MNCIATLVILSLLTPLLVQADYRQLSAEQKHALQIVLDQPVIQNGKLLKPTPIRELLPDDFPYDYDKLVGAHPYRPGRKHAKEAVFASPETFWFALRDLAREHNLSVPLLASKIAAPSAEFVNALREEGLELVLRWIQDHDGNLPEIKRDYGYRPGQIPVDYERLTRVLYPTAQEFWQALKAYAKTRQVEIDLIHVNLSPPLTESTRKILQKEALDLVVQWMQKNQGRPPSPRSFGSKENQIPISYQRLTGTYSYHPRATGIFSSIQEFWIQLKAHAQKSSLSISLLNHNFNDALEPETRSVLHKELNELVLKWMRQHAGQLPEPRDFGFEKGQIPVSYFRLAGTDAFSPTGPWAHAALFSNVQEFWLQFQVYAAHKTHLFRLLDVPVLGELQGPARQKLQEEVLDLVIAWMQNPLLGRGQLPTLQNFGFAADQIPVHPERLIKPAGVQDGLSSLRIFPTAREFIEALNTRLMRVTRGQAGCASLVEP